MIRNIEKMCTFSTHRGINVAPKATIAFVTFTLI